MRKSAARRQAEQLAETVMPRSPILRDGENLRDYLHAHIREAELRGEERAERRARRRKP